MQSARRGVSPHLGKAGVGSAHAGAVGNLGAILLADDNFHPAVLLTPGRVVVARKWVLLAVTLHLDALRGDNAHHLVEATFKAAARALDRASSIDPRRAESVPSTKGVL